jgi:hypothetical protein
MTPTRSCCPCRCRNGEITIVADPVPAEGNLLRERKFSLGLDVGGGAVSRGQGGTGVAFIKRVAGPLDETTPIAAQLQVRAATYPPTPLAA